MTDDDWDYNAPKWKAGELEDGKYYASNGTLYNNCRPVRKDEVTFYEDKKDD